MSRVAPLVGLLFVLSLSGLPALAEDAKPDRIERLEEQIEILADEIERLKTEEAVPEEIPEQIMAEGTGVYGLGPAASKVYRRDKGLSIGGYGELRLREYVSDTDEDDIAIYDAVRFVTYIGYKFNDSWVLNSEIEVEHADTGSNGSVAMEFITLDYLWREELNFRTGLLLVPMGFINEVHEPPFYLGAERPEVERRIIPTTWRENGAGIFGGFADDMISYRIYMVNGFDASGFSDSGLRGGRQKGSEALADQWAVVGRFDLDLSDWVPGLEFGGSGYTGKSGQNQNFTRCIAFCSETPGTPEIADVTVTQSLPDTWTTIYEAHAQYKAYGLSIRGLFAQAFLDDAGQLSRKLGKSATNGIANEMLGGYAEIGYDVMPLIDPESGMSLEPFFRFEHVDTQHSMPTGFSKDKNKIFDAYVVGFSWKPIPEIVFKLDYRNFEAERGDIADQVQAAVGFVF